MYIACSVLLLHDFQVTRNIYSANIYILYTIFI